MKLNGLEKVKKTSFFTDFKKFITKGNIIDLAVAVVIGNAFNKIVTSVVNGIIMPLIGIPLGKIHFDDLKWVITPAKDAVLDESGNVVTEAVTEVAVLYGSVIQNIVDFLIVALCIFIALRIIMRAKNKLNETEIREAADKAKAEAEESSRQAEAAAAEAKAAEDKRIANEEAVRSNIARQTELLEKLCSMAEKH